MTHLGFLRTRYLLLSLIAFVLFDCSTRQATVNDTQQAVDQAADAFEELNEETATKKARQKTVEADKIPGWYLNQGDDRYFYSDRTDVLDHPTNYSELLTQLRREIYQDLSEQVGIRILSIFEDIQIEEGNTQKKYVESLVRTYSSASFFADDISWVAIPSRHNVSAGDTLFVYARFDYQRYQQRLVEQKQEASRKAKQQFEEAYTNLDAGDLQAALDRLTRTKYFVDQGGGGEVLLYYRDRTLGPKTIHSQLNTLHAEMKKKLQLRIESEHLGQIVEYERESPLKQLKIRVYSPSSGDLDFRAITLDLINRETGGIIQTSETNANGLVIFNLQQVLEGETGVETSVRFSLRPNGLDAKLWYTLPAYREFKANLADLPVSLRHIEFSPQNIITVLTKSQTGELTEDDLMIIENRLQQQLTDEPDYFNLITSAVGMNKWELKRVVSQQTPLTDEQVDKLGDIRFILHGSVETVGGQYQLVLKMLRLRGKQITSSAMVTSRENYSKGNLISIGVERVFQKLLSQYFHRSIMLRFQNKVDFTIRVNNEPVDRSKIEMTNNGREANIISLSRYHSQTITVHTKQYRTFEEKLPPEKFSLIGRKVTQNVIQKDVKLVPKQGTMDIRIVDTNNTPLKNLGRKQTVIEWYQTQWLFLNKNHHDTTGTSTLATKVPPGIWYVNAAHPGYETPAIPDRVKILDDYEMNGPKQISIQLAKKPLSRAIARSTVIPGWGHNYLDKPFWQQSIPALTYAGFTSLALYSYFSFTSAKNDFIRKQRIYENAPPTEWENTESAATSAWDKMQTAKYTFQFAISGAILTNVGTSALLYLEEKWK